MPLNGVRGHRELALRLIEELGRRPSHAYLFSGPRGTGKALVAAGIVHSILCERSPGENFCCTPEHCPVRIAPAVERIRARANENAPPRCDCCAACVQAAAGAHPDFSHLAKAAGRTDVLIEQVRELIAQLGRRPARAPMRLAIIDDAETLNIPAQNALLKTLEEPPGHAIIFMISASERALLDTVRSRMRPVRFGALSTADLEAILAARGVADPVRAGAIARLARGSAARAIALIGGGEPPMAELIAALADAKSIDFARASAIAQEFFATRDAAAANFELLARVLEEIVCYKLIGTGLAAAPPRTEKAMAAIASRADAPAIAECAAAAVSAIEAVEAMANPRLQAEKFWTIAGRTLGKANGGTANRSV
ncbi:MAG: ATP-binding protein [Candidatus Binataceae bacterium]